jgi:hypothetical protein
MNLKKIILCFLLVFPVTCFALAKHEVDPIYKSDTVELNVWGYSKMTYGAEKDFVSYPTRERMSIKYKEHWLAFAEIDVSHFLQPNAPYNPVTQAWVGYSFGKTDNIFSDVTIRAGSLLTAGALYLPPAYMTTTVASPTNPFGHYANGFQVSKIWKDVTVMADVTGATKLAIDNPQRMSRVETSQRVDWNAIKNKEGKTTLQLSLMNAWSNDVYHRMGLGVKYNPTPNLGLYAGMFRAHERLTPAKAITETGGYALAEYNLFKFRGGVLDLDVRPHAMIEKVNGPKDYTGYTGGVSFVLPEDGGYRRLNGSKVTFDYTNQTTTTDNGPKVEGSIFGIGILVFF